MALISLAGFYAVLVLIGAGTVAATTTDSNTNNKDQKCNPAELYVSPDQKYKHRKYTDKCETTIEESLRLTACFKLINSYDGEEIEACIEKAKQELKNGANSNQNTQGQNNLNTSGSTGADLGMLQSILQSLQSSMSSGGSGGQDGGNQSSNLPYDPNQLFNPNYNNQSNNGSDYTSCLTGGDCPYFNNDNQNNPDNNINNPPSGNIFDNIYNNGSSNLVNDISNATSSTDVIRALLKEARGLIEQTESDIKKTEADKDVDLTKAKALLEQASTTLGAAEDAYKKEKYQKAINLAAEAVDLAVAASFELKKAEEEFDNRTPLTTASPPYKPGDNTFFTGAGDGAGGPIVAPQTSISDIMSRLLNNFSNRGYTSTNQPSPGTSGPSSNPSSASSNTCPAPNNSGLAPIQKAAQGTLIGSSPLDSQAVRSLTLTLAGELARSDLLRIAGAAGNVGVLIDSTKREAAAIISVILAQAYRTDRTVTEQVFKPNYISSVTVDKRAYGNLKTFGESNIRAVVQALIEGTLSSNRAISTPIDPWANHYYQSKTVNPSWAKHLKNITTLSSGHVFGNAIYEGIRNIRNNYGASFSTANNQQSLCVQPATPNLSANTGSPTTSGNTGNTPTTPPTSLPTPNSNQNNPTATTPPTSNNQEPQTTPPTSPNQPSLSSNQGSCNCIDANPSNFGPARPLPVNQSYIDTMDRALSSLRPDLPVNVKLFSGRHREPHKDPAVPPSRRCPSGGCPSGRHAYGNGGDTNFTLNGKALTSNAAAFHIVYALSAASRGNVGIGLASRDRITHVDFEPRTSDTVWAYSGASLKTRDYLREALKAGAGASLSGDIDIYEQSELAYERYQREYEPDSRLAVDDFVIDVSSQLAGVGHLFENIWDWLRQLLGLAEPLDTTLPEQAIDQLDCINQSCTLYSTDPESLASSSPLTYAVVRISADPNTGIVELHRDDLEEHFSNLESLSGEVGEDEAYQALTADNPIIFDANGRVSYSNGIFAPATETPDETTFLYVVDPLFTEEGSVASAGTVNALEGRSWFTDRSPFYIDEVTTVSYQKIDGVGQENEIIHQYTIGLGHGEERTVRLPESASLTYIETKLADTGYRGNVAQLLSMAQAERDTITEPEGYSLTDITAVTIYTNAPVACVSEEATGFVYLAELQREHSSTNKDFLLEMVCAEGTLSDLVQETSNHLTRWHEFEGLSATAIFEVLYTDFTEINERQVPDEAMDNVRGIKVLLEGGIYPGLERP